MHFLNGVPAEVFYEWADQKDRSSRSASSGETGNFSRWQDCIISRDRLVRRETNIDDYHYLTEPIDGSFPQPNASDVAG